MGRNEVLELQLFIENDGELYRQRIVPIEKNLRSKKNRGVFDKDKALRSFILLAKVGAIKYAKEFGGSSWKSIFCKEDLDVVAKNFLDGFLDEELVSHELG